MKVKSRLHQWSQDIGNGRNTGHLPTKAADFECSWSKGMVTCAVGWRDRATQACWSSSCQTWSCKFGICLLALVQYFLATFHLGMRNILCHCTPKTQTFVFLYYWDSQSRVYLNSIEDARSWAAKTLHYEMGHRAMGTEYECPGLSICVSRLSPQLWLCFGQFGIFGRWCLAGRSGVEA